MLLVLLTLFLVDGANNLTPKTVVWPPATRTCTYFSMDILSYDSSGDIKPDTLDVNVNLYDSSWNLLRSQLCKLTGINGCTVYSYTTTSPGTYYIKILEDSPVSTLWTSSGFTVTQGSSLSYFTFSFSIASPSAWQDFSVTVTLMDGCGVIYVVSSQVTLSATNGISGTLVQTTSTGSAIFNVYCQTTGSNIIVATSSSISSNTTISILQDKISIISLVPIVSFI